MLNPERVHLREGSHWVSPFNFEPDVQSQFDWPEPLALVDSTLRKTLFTAGALTSMDGFVRIAEALAEAGSGPGGLRIGRGDPPAQAVGLTRTHEGSWGSL